MVAEFQKWIKNNYSKISEYIDNIQVNSQDPENLSLYIDFLTKTDFARFTLWNIGTCDIESLNIISGERLFYENYQNISEDTMFTIFFDFLKRIGIPL